MALGSSCASQISLSSTSARCHCSPFPHALIPALKLMTLGSSFASHILLSNARARCHCSPFAHALIPALKLRHDGGLQLRLPHLAQKRQRPLPLLALLARADPGAVARWRWAPASPPTSRSAAPGPAATARPSCTR
ncbi:unnamed protein product [Prorocentrum cordatum]|uniref:Uncharacterized protein n=1 Tax=Prorocentrum cordatum TaxID=2364126 RepID=A0ABN9TYZ9_9DINO|nr:unnamed protein product [Polarella glacialis]